MYKVVAFRSCSVDRFRIEGKETKGRSSSGQTHFTIKPKQLALKKNIFNPKKILPKLRKKKLLLLYHATF